MSTMGLSHFQWRHATSQTPSSLIAKHPPDRDYDYAKHQGVVANESKESFFFLCYTMANQGVDRGGFPTKELDLGGRRLG